MSKVSTRAEIITRRTYNRPKNDDGTIFESWEETVDRVISHQAWLWERAKGSRLRPRQLKELEAFRQLMLDRKVSVSGRTLWLGGTEVSKRREASQFNCSFTQVETIYDVVDCLWLLLQGCGVGFMPVRGTLNGFFKPINDIEVVRSIRTEKGGEQENRESWDPKEKIWTISVGDSAEGWAKSIGKLLAGKYPADKLILDFSSIRPAGERLKGYGWISSGDESIATAYTAIAAIMNKRAGSLLSAIDILDILNWLGTVLSSRRSAEIALLSADDPEWKTFATAKKDYWAHNNNHRCQSNNSLVFYSKPSKERLTEIFKLMEDSGGSEPGFINGEAALKRAPWFKGCNPCLHPDSIVETVNGRVKIKDITEPTMVYTKLEDGSLGIRACSASWISKRNANTLNITTQMGHTIRVTPDHKIFTEEKGWIEAKDLKLGDTLIHLRRSRRGLKYSGVSLTSDKRRSKEAQVMEHRLIWEAHYGELPDSWDVHHIDGDTYNNSIDNLEALPHSEHSTLTRNECDNNHMINGYNEKLGKTGFISTNSNYVKTIIPMPNNLRSAPSSQFAGRIISIEIGEVTDVYDLTVKDTHNFVADYTIVHNCAEILLGNKSFCNLVEVDISKFQGDSSGLREALTLAARANYRQTCVNLRDGILQESWHLNNEFLRLCGVGLTGIARRGDLGAYDYQELQRFAVSAAYSMADELGMQHPKNITTIKPSGTLSKIMDCPEGVHTPLGRYIFNNVNFSKHDPIISKLIEAGYKVIPNPTDPEGTLVTFPVRWDDVEFTTINGMEVNVESATLQLERYKLLQSNWTQQNTSVTISYDLGEVSEIIDWMLENWDLYVGVSFIYRADPTKSAKDLGYLYLPQEVVTKGVFDEYSSRLTEVNVNDFNSFEEIFDAECSGGVCPVK